MLLRYFFSRNPESPKQLLASSFGEVTFAVTNHLNFCMMATTLTWIYADKLQKMPDRKFKIKGRASFAFSDVRRIMAEAILNPDFQSICPLPTQLLQNSIIKTLLRMVA